MNLTNVLDKKFIGADDFRKDLTNILEKLPKEGGIVVTQHGKPRGILLDVESYLELEEVLEQIEDSDPKLIKRINKALADVRKNGGIPAEKVWEELGI